MGLQMSIESFNIFAFVVPRKASIRDLSDKTFIANAIDLVKEKKSHLIGHGEDKTIIAKYDKTINELQKYLTTL